jgi:hypothetical protein
MAEAFTPETSPIRVRFGVVSSVETDRTMTVVVGGGTVSGVRYAAGMTPCPGYSVFLLTDGADLFAVDHMAADDLTLAPRAYRTADVNINTATDTAVSMQAVASDAWGTWVSGAATRLTAPVTGRYTANAVVRWESNGTGLRAAWITKNGADVIGRVQIAALSGSPTMFTVASTPTDLAKGDYIELHVRQTSGGNLALIAADTYFPSLGFTYLGP